MLGKQAKNIILAIGSNLGNKQHNILKAKYLINTDKKIKIISSSSFYKTESWPNKNDPYFLNIVLKCTTILNPEELFVFIKKIEKSLGRSKSYKNAPRTCDIDIIDYSQKNMLFTNIDLKIPHPRMHNRSFVLFPLFEIDKNWKHPKNNKKITQLLNNLPSTSLRSINIL